MYLQCKQLGKLFQFLRDNQGLLLSLGSFSLQHQHALVFGTKPNKLYGHTEKEVAFGFWVCE